MSAIHSLWGPPPSDGTELQFTIYQLQMELLNAVEQRLEGTLTKPKDVGGKRIMDACLAASMLRSMDRSLRPHVLDDLQRRLRTIEPSLPNRIFLPPPPRQSAIPADFGERIVAISRATCFLESWLKLGKFDSESNLDPDIAIGVFLILVVRRAGICWPRQLAAIIESLDEPLGIAGPWCFRTVSLPDSPSAPGQNRRIYLDPILAAAYGQAQKAFQRLPLTKLPKKPSKRPQFFNRLANTCVKAAWAASAIDEPLVDSLKKLCLAQECALRLETLPILATYAAGRIASSSISDSSWLALLGFSAPTESNGATADIKPRNIETGLSLKIGRSKVDDDPNLLVESGDRSNEGLTADIRRITGQEPSTWQEGFDDLLKRPELAGPSNTGRLVVKWLDHLAHERKNKEKHLSPGTVRYKRGLVVHRLLTSLPDDIGDLSAEDFTDLYLEVANSGATPVHSGRILAALGDFHRFICETVPAFPTLGGLPGFGGGYAISAHIISEEEFKNAMASLDDGRIAIPTDELRLQVKVVLILAFRLGLRRNEILGLYKSDWHELDCLLVRDNHARTLKSKNSKRKGPFALLTPSEQELIIEFFKSDHPYPFFPGKTCPTHQDLDNHPAIRLVNNTLKRAVIGRNVHPHNLRHSTASWAIFGMFAADVGYETFPIPTAWMDAAIARAEILTNTLTSPFKRHAARGTAVSVLLGHGTDTMTYQHYVHVLDLLLHIACTPKNGLGCSEERKLRDGEKALFNAVMGLHPTTVVETHDLEALYLRLARQFPDATQVYSLRKDTGDRLPSGSANHKGADDKVESNLSLEAVLNFLTDAEQPQSQAERDTIGKTLEIWNQWITKDATKANNVLSTLVGSRIKGRDYSSLAVSGARELLQDAADLGTEPTSFDCLHVVSQKGTRRISKNAVDATKLRRGKVKEEGKIWIRLRDPRRQSGAQRQKTQSTVTKTLLAIHGLFI